MNSGFWYIYFVFLATQEYLQMPHGDVYMVSLRDPEVGIDHAALLTDIFFDPLDP